MPQRRTSRTRLFASTLAGLLLLTVLAACNNATAPGSSTSGPTGPTGTFTYETVAAPDTLDPVAAYNTRDGAVLENIYDTLYTFTPAGGTAPQPSLATSYTVSPDNLTYTFNLRSGVTFHSGNPFTCADVEYSIERALVVDPPSSGAWTVALPLTGHTDTSSLTWNDIDSTVTCTDPHQVVFHLQQVSPAFVVILSQTTYGIVDSVWAKGHGEWDGTQNTWRNWIGRDLTKEYLNNHASGTGAYRLTGVTASSTTATAFGGYWGSAPSFKDVHVDVVTDYNQRVSDLLAGTADRIDLDQNHLGLVNGKSGVTVHRDPSWSSLTATPIQFNEAVTSGSSYIGTGVLGGGTPTTLFADKDARLCFAYSFDPTAYINDALGGHGTELTMAMPPSLLGYNTSITPYSADSATATTHCQAALSGNLWSSGFTMTAVYNTSNASSQIALQNLKSHVEALNNNFHISLKGETSSAFFNDLLAGNLPVYVQGWQADYPDPDNFVRTFYDSTGFYGQHMSFHDATIDTQIDQAYATTDATQRESLYNQIGQEAHDLAPLVPLPQPVPAIVTRASLKGVTYDAALNGQFRWKDVSN